LRIKHIAAPGPANEERLKADLKRLREDSAHAHYIDQIAAEARGWSQADAVRALNAHAASEAKQHADDASLPRQWKRWETGDVSLLGDFYKPIIARTFGTVMHAMFPVPAPRDADTDVLAITRIARSN